MSDDHDHDHDGCPDCDAHDDDDEAMSPEELLEAIEQSCAEGAYEDAQLLASLGQAAFDAGEIDDAGLRARLDVALAELDRCQGELERATTSVARAILAFERLGAAHEAGLAGALYTSALVALEQGRLETAMSELDRSARLLEQQQPIDAGQFASVLTTMGEVSLDVGEPDAAQRLFGRVLEVLREAEASSGPHAGWLNAITGKAFLGLGGAAVQIGNAHDAKDYLERATEFLDAGLGAGHPVMIESLERICELYRAMGESDAAALAEQELAAARAAQVKGADDDEGDEPDDPEGSAPRFTRRS